MEISFTHLSAHGATSILDVENWIIEEQQPWAIFSTEGDIGSLLGELLCDEPYQGDSLASIHNALTFFLMSKPIATKLKLKSYKHCVVIFWCI